eukprot:694778-Pleurochrysis_carterae.AAC.3
MLAFKKNDALSKWRFSSVTNTSEQHATELKKREEALKQKEREAAQGAQRGVKVSEGGQAAAASRRERCGKGSCRARSRSSKGCAQARI